MLQKMCMLSSFHGVTLYRNNEVWSCRAGGNHTLTLYYARYVPVLQCMMQTCRARVQKVREKGPACNVCSH